MEEIKPKNKRTKKVVLLIVLSLILLGSLYAGISIFNKEPEKIQEQQAIEQDPLLDKIRTSVEQEQNRIEEYSSSFNAISDFSAYNEEDIDSIGESIMKRLYESREYTKLLEVAGYLEKRGGAIAITALRYCYVFSDNQQTKNACLERLTAEAKKQGIISADEALSASFLSISEEQIAL